MTTSDKCPKCAGQMQEGFILDQSHGEKLVSSWIAGKPEKSFLGGVKVRNKERHVIQTFRCQKCGFLESYANDESNATF